MPCGREKRPGPLATDAIWQHGSPRWQVHQAQFLALGGSPSDYTRSEKKQLHVSQRVCLFVYQKPTVHRNWGLNFKATTVKSSRGIRAGDHPTRGNPARALKLRIRDILGVWCLVRGPGGDPQRVPRQRGNLPCCHQKKALKSAKIKLK